MTPFPRPTAMPTLMARLNAGAGDRTISAAEAESVDLRVAGWSFGGSQSVNFTHDLGRTVGADGRGPRIGGYRLKQAVPVQRLATWDPVVQPPVKIRRGPVGQHVKGFVNFYQRARAVTEFHELDATGAPTGVVRRDRGIGGLVIAGGEVLTDYPAGAPQVVQFRVEQDLANDPQERDRVAAGGPGDPLIQPGETGWRAFGSTVNHSTVTWYAYRRTRDELSS